MAAAAAAPTKPHERTHLLDKAGKGWGPHEFLGVAQLARLVTFASSFSEGWDIAIFGLVIIPVSKEFGLSAVQLGLLASVPNAAGILGYLSCGACMDAWGRRPALIATYVTGLLGCLLMASAQGVLTLGVGRSVLIFGIRGGTTCVTVYMTELSPARSRGVLVSLEEVYVNVGICLASLTAWHWLGQAQLGWRSFVLCGALAPTLTLLLFTCLRMPESPRYHYRIGRHDAAVETLRRALGGQEEELRRTLELWQSEEAHAAEEQKRRGPGQADAVSIWFAEVWEVFHQKGFRVAALCWFARAGSGITAVATFFTVLLHPFMSEEAALRWFLFSMVVKLLAILPSSLYLIDRCGRIPLFVTSALGCSLSLAVASAVSVLKLEASVLALALLAYMLFFSVGYGPVTWVYCFEILPAERGRASALSQVPGDILAFALLTALPVLDEVNHALPLALVAGTSLMAAGFFSTCPETKGLVLEEAKLAMA